MLLANPNLLNGLSLGPDEPLPADVVARAREIRDFVAAAPLDRFTVLAGRDPRPAVSAFAALLSCVRATDDEALAVAIDTSAQLAGSEAEIEHVISGVRITVSAEEPEDEITDVTALSFDGACVAGMSTRRCQPVALDAHWESMHGYAARPPYDPAAPRPAMID